jgi:hypothetical protein
MELEYFCHPSTSSRYFDEWVTYCWQWLINLGIRPSSLRRKIYHSDLAHYATATTDIEFKVSATCTYILFTKQLLTPLLIHVTGQYK